MPENVLLIVDDDTSIQHSIGEYFLRKGYQVLTAGTGEEALKLFQSRNPELILLDLKLPDTDGLDLLIVDYIQLVRTTKTGEARHEELSMIAGSLKQLAKQLKIPVVTASQLNNEGRMAKAKSIGDDADVVMRIEEDGIYVLKNRNGEKHVMLNLKLDGKMQRFEETYQ